MDEETCYDQKIKFAIDEMELNESSQQEVIKHFDTSANRIEIANRVR